jgi:hypothetical protein
MDPNEIAWKWMNHETNFYDLSAIIHDALEQGEKPAEIGNRLMRYFYDQTPFFGEDSFWVELLGVCMERVGWTALARRAIAEIDEAEAA